MVASNHDHADQILVTQCQAGDPATWEQLLARLRERGQHVLPKALSKDAIDKALRDELIEDTLTNLFLNQQLLDSFLRSRRRLNDYLDYLLNRAVKRHYQKRARRMRHEVLLSLPKLAKLIEVRWLPSIQEELLKRLTPAERRYFDWARLPHEQTPPCPVTKTYARQLEHRILKKARRLLSGE